MTRFGAPPTSVEAVPNIEAPTKTDRFINFRVTPEEFKEIKKAALDADMPLGRYLIHTHAVYQRSIRG